MERIAAMIASGSRVDPPSSTAAGNAVARLILAFTLIGIGIGALEIASGAPAMRVADATDPLPTANDSEEPRQ